MVLKVVRSGHSVVEQAQILVMAVEYLQRTGSLKLSYRKDFAVVQNMLGVAAERAGTDNCCRIVKLCGIGRGWQLMSFGIHFLVVGHARFFDCRQR